MVVVTIELWPKGDRTKKRIIGQALIINDGTGSEQTGEYSVRLKHAGIFWGRPGFWKRGGCTYRRNLSPYHLVLAALKAVL